MNIIKKFTAIIISTKTINELVSVSLDYGEITGPYYSQQHQEQEFDTEEEAIKYAETADKYATWLILPTVRFQKKD